jgi:NAD(P)-dependent dehydrogenase (short-subunit alcohol dehydrogenase family)
MGSLTSFPDMSGYQSSKMALNRFTELIHLEYVEKGVRVFAFHPGLHFRPAQITRDKLTSMIIRRDSHRASQSFASVYAPMAH